MPPSLHACQASYAVRTLRAMVDPQPQSPIDSKGTGCWTEYRLRLWQLYRIEQRRPIDGCFQGLQGFAHNAQAVRIILFGAEVWISANMLNATAPHDSICPR